MLDLDIIIYDAINHMKCNNVIKNKILFIVMKFFRINRKQLTDDKIK